MSVEIVVAQRQTHWAEKTLDQCATIQTGVSKGRKTNQEELVSVPYLRVANVQDGYLDLSEIKEIQVRPQEVARYALQPGDVLLTEGGDFDKLGRGFVWNGELPECIHQNHVFAVRVDQSQLNPHFFAYQAQSPHGKQYFLSVAHKTTNLACINTTKLKAFPVLVPPLSEQKEIVRILSTVKRAISAQERIIQTTTELKQALMQKLFSEGLRGEPQKETEVGLVPESWEVVKLGMHIQIAHGYAFQGKFFVSDGPTVLTPGNFRLDGGLYWGKRTKFTTECYEPNVVLHPGELVVVMTDLTPTAKLLGGPAFIPNGRTILHNQRIGKVVMKSNKTSLQFLYWVFLSESFKRYMRQTATGSTVRHTSPSKIYGYSFGLPSLDEQAMAIDSLAKVDEKLANIEIKKLALQDLFRTLLHELMTAKISLRELGLINRDAA